MTPETEEHPAERCGVSVEDYHLWASGAPVSQELNDQIRAVLAPPKQEND